MAALNFHPLAGGLPPDLAWSVSNCSNKVLPGLRRGRGPARSPGDPGQRRSGRYFAELT
jgi:hypothetical protein